MNAIAKPLVKRAAYLFIGCAVFSLVSQVLFAVWASLYAGGLSHFEHTPIVTESVVWPPVGDVSRPEWWRFDRSHPQWSITESRPDHPMAFIRYAWAMPSSMFGVYDYPESTDDIDWGPDYKVPPPGSVESRYSDWLPIWDTPEGFWRRHPGHDGSLTFIAIGWPSPAFVVRTLPTEDRMDDEPFGSYRFIDRVPPRGRMPRKLPRHVYWRGLAINTVFWLPVGACLYGLWQGVRIGFRGFVLRRRVKRGLCGRCKYPLARTGVCPECGSAT